MYREKKVSALLLLRFAFQSLGVVYGDLGTSPVYVFYNTFPDGVDDTEDIIGALSLIIYSLTLVPLIKYVFIVCRANDNGQGGTFALYSLLCRHAKVNTIPNQHRTDEKLTTYSRATIHEKSFAAKTKRWLEGDLYKKNALLLLVLVGTCMAIGDGILAPAISVLSAVGGIKIDHPGMSNEIEIVVAVLILIGLFSLQHYGVDKVGWLFAPIVLLWFLLIGGIGIFNIWKHDIWVLRAFSPVYIFRYFKRRGKNGWTSLGGIMLSITGLRNEGFTMGQAALKAASCKVMKHEKACIENQHVFIPFAFDTFGFLAPEAVDLLTRVQRVMHSNVMTPKSMDVVFKRVSFAIQKGVAAQLVARLPTTSM